MQLPLTRWLQLCSLLLLLLLLLGIFNIAEDF